jgi:probable rRNA maturation factor
MRHEVAQEEGHEAGIQIFLNALSNLTLPESAIRRGLLALLEAEGIETGELSVTFLDDTAAQELNRIYLDHDWVPDVLSFPLSPPLLGDIYIAVEQARRQALAYGVTVSEELLRLAIHGTLHVVGYDHPEEPELRDTSAMMERQEAWVRRVKDLEGWE